MVQFLLWMKDAWTIGPAMYNNHGKPEGLLQSKNKRLTLGTIEASSPRSESVIIRATQHIPLFSYRIIEHLGRVPREETDGDMVMRSIPR